MVAVPPVTVPLVTVPCPRLYIRQLLRAPASEYRPYIYIYIYSVSGCCSFSYQFRSYVYHNCCKLLQLYIRQLSQFDLISGRLCVYVLSIGPVPLSSSRAAMMTACRPVARTMTHTMPPIFSEQPTLILGQRHFPFFFLYYIICL